MSAAKFQQHADAAIADIRARGKRPILVGGAGFYYRGLIDGLFDGPGANADIRARLEAEAERIGNDALHERLADIDARAAHRIHPNDRIRIIRALEVYELTGEPISSLQRQWEDEPPRYEVVAFGLRRPRDVLNRRANARVKRMLEEGLLDEVRRLRERYDLNHPAFQGYGYVELWEHLDGKHTFDKAIELLKRNTHRYAKRQMTWFRADRRLVWIDIAEDSTVEELSSRIVHHITWRLN